MRTAFAIASLLLSGAAGLAYQILWIRQASVVFGSTLLSVSTVLAVFFLGLALGSEGFGRLARRVSRPMLLFALLEGAAALFGASTPWAFGAIDFLYAQLPAGLDPTTLTGVRIGLVGLILLPGTIAMGGALPLFARVFVVDGERIASPVGGLYGVHTLGGALGCLAAGLWLFPQLGLRGATLVAALGNLLAAGLAIVARVRERTDPAAEPDDRGRPPGVLISVLVFLGGAAALGNEVLWTRFLSLLVTRTVDVVTLTVAIVLFGIVIGSALAARLHDRLRLGLFAFGWLQVAIGLTTLASMRLPSSFWSGLEGEDLLIALLILPPAALSGLSFPLAVRIGVHRAVDAGRGVGRLNALSTLGGIFGSLSVGFLLLPTLGLEASLRLLSGLSVASGLMAWWGARGRERALLRFAATGIALGLWLAMPSALPTRLPADFLADPDEELVAFEEGLGANVAVLRRGDVTQLEIDRWWQGEDRPNHQVLAGHLPALLHPHPRRVLVVGVGAGQTPRSILLHERVESLDVVDIEPAVFAVIREHFDAQWLADPRVRRILEDGRHHLAREGPAYDLISLELGQVFRAGVAAFYTREFYRLARRRLAESGMLTQFVPLAFLPPDTLRSVLATFLEAFPESQLWYNESELLLVGGQRPFRMDPGRLLEIRSPPLHGDLAIAHWGGPSHRLNRPSRLVACFLMGRAGLTRLTHGAHPLTDDLPALEYAASRVRPADTNEIPAVQLLREHLDPIAHALAGELSAAEPEALAEMRERNLGDLVASALLRRLDRTVPSPSRRERLATIERALEANPESVAARLAKADAFLERGDLEEARVAYEAGLAIDPEAAALRFGLAFSLHRLGRWWDAIPHYEAGLALRPGEAEAHNNYGAARPSRGSPGRGARVRTGARATTRVPGRHAQPGAGARADGDSLGGRLESRPPRGEPKASEVQQLGAGSRCDDVRPRRDRERRSPSGRGARAPGAAPGRGSHPIRRSSSGR